MASDVERIKEKLPIEEVVGAYVSLDHSGGRLKGRCPFHSEKTPSFFVSPERGTYYCFGCAAKGDIFTFVQEFEGLDFTGALKTLAERAGIELTHRPAKERDETQALYDLLERATLYYQKQLAERKDVIKYLTDRGLTISTIKSWKIGFAPDEWKSASTALIGKGYTPALIEKAGLTKPSEKNPQDHYDRFRSRIMFPLFDGSGRVVGFSGRIFGDDTEAAKYLNSPETALFDKSSFLYGFDRAKLSIRKEGSAVLVEGQMDIIMSHQSGVTNVVAVSGTALTDRHVDTLKRFAPKLLMAFDADTAGQRASARATAIALSKGMEVNVIRIEGGKDPADLVKENPELWRSAVATPIHVIEYELERSLKESDTRKRAKIIEGHVLPYVAVLISPLEQAHFISRISLASSIGEKALTQAVKNIDVADVITTEPASRTKVQSGARIDMVDRRVAALLLWLRQEKHKRPDLSSQYIEEYIIEHLGAGMLKNIESMIAGEVADLAFEGEASFNNAQSLRKEVDEILVTLREEHLKKQLAEAMMSLKRAEIDKNMALTATLLKKCQDISNQLHKLKQP